MYLGRIVAIGMTPAGKAAAMYRVSSRSFPNREAVLIGGQVAILPRAGFESDLRKNPYISYNCIRIAGEWAVATNGSQTDPIVEKIAMGIPPRDAISLGLLAMDYEKDSLDRMRCWCGSSRWFPARSVISPPTRRTRRASIRLRPGSTGSAPNAPPPTL